MLTRAGFFGKCSFSSLSGTKVSPKTTRIDSLAFELLLIRQIRKRPKVICMSISEKFELPETGFIRLAEILLIFPVSRASWWAGIRAGIYPAGVKIGPRTTAWRVEEIRKLIKDGPLNINKESQLAR